VRRRIVEQLADGELPTGDIVTAIRSEFGISQPAVSQHLKVLRDNGFVVARAEGTRRIYALQGARLREIDDWIARFRMFWAQPLDALATEVARGKRARRRSAEAASAPSAEAASPRVAIERQADELVDERGVAEA
jgi:DNA-binding transcriptional ArsR family regulator